MSSPQNTPPPTLPLHSPVSPDDSSPTTLQVWQKMSAQEYKALGLNDDPVRHWVITELYPLYVEAIHANSIPRARAAYVKTTLFDIFEKTWQFKSKNYNIAAFKEASIISGFIILGASSHRPTSLEIHTDSDAERKPRAASAIAMFKREHEAEIVQERDAEAARQAAAGKPPTHQLALYNATLTKMYQGSDASVKAEMEEQARRANQAIDAGPTADDIAKNQKTIDEAIAKKLKSLMGHGWTGHGDMVFFVRAGFVNRDNKIATLCLAVGPKYTVEPYASSREDEETKEFAEYAVKVLSPAPTIEPTLEVDGAGNTVLPKIKTQNTSSQTLRQLLKGYAAITRPEAATACVILVNAEGSQVNVDDASREELIFFYNKIRQLRKAGTEVPVMAGTIKPPGDGQHSGASLPQMSPLPPGDAATFLPDTTLAGAGAGVPISNLPASDTTDVPTTLVNAANFLLDTTFAGAGADTLVSTLPVSGTGSGDPATFLQDTTLAGAGNDIPNVEPVILPAVNVAVETNLDDIQPQLTSSSTLGEHVAHTLPVGKRKRVMVHDDMCAGKSVKRQALMIKEKNVAAEPRRSTRSKAKGPAPTSKPVNKSGNIRGWRGYAAVDEDGNEVNPEEYVA
ncbi:hypothetical protein MSAN_02261300 [Mycena sanguinolenta]|uniref:Uncharacterized protein n=1 Tax=Mycena sanguinolenta TaxID=230812 RepID=A0A8H6XBB5_9AGAR|nr:hypothetical protein MSAN_02261300 [Mycena sanguinolenta]